MIEAIIIPPNTGPSNSTDPMLSTGSGGEAIVPAGTGPDSGPLIFTDAVA